MKFGDSISGIEGVQWMEEPCMEQSESGGKTGVVPGMVYRSGIYTDEE